MRPGILIAGLGLAIAAILVLEYWPVWFGDDESLAEPVMVSPELPTPAEEAPGAAGPSGETQATTASERHEAAEPAPTSAPQIPLPPLNESDDFVRTQVEGWGLPSRLLQREDLLARFATVLVNAADGSIAVRETAVLAPAEKFQVIRQPGNEAAGEDERLFIDPASFRRFDGYVSTLEAIDPEQLAGVLLRLTPLIDEAMAQLGEPRSVASLVQQALDRLEQLPQLPASVEVVQPNVMYEYADPELEALPGFAKQLLRFGPDNIARLRSYFSRFAAEYRSD